MLHQEYFKVVYMIKNMCKLKVVVFLLLFSCISIASEENVASYIDTEWYEDIIYSHTKFTESNIAVDGKSTGLYVVISYYQEQYYFWLLKEMDGSEKIIIKDIKIVDNSGANVLANVGSCIYKNRFDDNILVAYYQDKVKFVESDYWVKDFVVAYSVDVNAEKFMEIKNDRLSCQHQYID